MTRGMLLLVAYSIGLGIPFLVAAVGLNWYLAGARRVMRWLRPLELGAGALLVVMGVLLFTGHFSTLASYLAGFGQLAAGGPVTARTHVRRIARRRSAVLLATAARPLTAQPPAERAAGRARRRRRRGRPHRRRLRRREARRRRSSS